MIDTSKVLKKGSRHEFHHIFPKKHLEGVGISSREANSLANICFLIRSDNNQIKNKPPADYFDEMSIASRDIYLQEAFCDYEDRNLSFNQFLNTRTARLVEHAYKLCDVPIAS